MRDQDANKSHNASDLKRTAAGRPVYSRRHRTRQARPGSARRLQTRRDSAAPSIPGTSYANYATRFDADGDSRIKQRRRPQGVKPNFVVDDAMVTESVIC